ncbi:hypothetical protein HY009_00555, partial [Candidatus Acetothermia bacterium]|nr:hypothetical protein [Candidatus Acetothermia bacterium]
MRGSLSVRKLPIVALAVVLLGTSLLLINSVELRAQPQTVPPPILEQADLVVTNDTHVDPHPALPNKSTQLIIILQNVGLA